MSEEKPNVLLEFFDLITNSKNGIEKVNGKYDVYIFGGDRECFTPHIHLVDKNTNIVIEISLLDWSIVHSKVSVNRNNMRIISDMVKSFTKWTQYISKNGLTNYVEIFEKADFLLSIIEKPSSLYEFAIKNDFNISDDLKDYFKMKGLTFDKKQH